MPCDPPPASVESTAIPARPAAWRIARRQRIAAPPERVWSAWTDGAELERWLCGDASVDLRVAGRIELRGASVFGDADASKHADNFAIVACDAPRHLAWQWFILGVRTCVDVVLEPCLEQTEVRVVQTAEPERAPAWPVEGPNWWWIALPALRAYLEDGAPRLRLDYRTDTELERLRFSVPVSTFPFVIWEKLTSAAELRRWCATKPEVEIVRGGRYIWHDAGREGPRSIIDFDAEKRLVHDWVWDDGTRSTIDWRISESDDDTVLAIEDRGPWPAAVVEDPVERIRAALSRAASLLHLQRISERGATPFEDELL